MKDVNRKKEILQVASKLIREKGYNAVTVRDIAKAIDIKAASLYNHIENKQEILSILILEVALEFTEKMNEIVLQKNNSVEKIKNIIEIHIDITVNYSDNIAALNNDWMHLQGDDLSKVISMKVNYENNFRNIIKEGISNGEIKKKQPDVILFSILSTLRTLYLWYQKRGKLDVNILKKDMVSVLLNGVVIEN